MIYRKIRTKFWEKNFQDKGIVLHYKVVVVEKGEEWGYKYSFTGWEYQ